MAGGWSRDGAVQEQIDASIEDAVQLARSRLGVGDSAHFCEHCEKSIPQARRAAVPGARLCVNCQTLEDGRDQQASSINRRGSKDSQLR